MNQHQEMMNRVLKLALRGSGKVSPNPRVGCVIVKENKIIAEGWHREFGGIHAEADALLHCIEDPKGAIAYVNLEPCSHVGKNPPCAPLLIEKGIKTVVIGMKDPNPLVSGKGIELLRKSGIEVIQDICTEESLWINRFFNKHIVSGIPYIIGKIAQSIDGCISTKSGDSQWISGKESRKTVHRLRAEVDAVLIGKGTALADNPSLTVRDVPGRNPLRIVLDTYCSLPEHLQIFTDDYASLTIICCSKEMEESSKVESLQKKGIHFLFCDTDESGKIDLISTLKSLYTTFHIGSILAECGGKLMSNFLQYGVLDELHVFIAPIIIGNGISAFNSIESNLLRDSYTFSNQAVLKSDEDLHIIYTKKI